MAETIPSDPATALTSKMSKMSQWIDLTLPWSAECTPVPGHPRIEVKPLHTHEVDGRSNSIARFSLHTATHIDAPYHFHRDGLTIERVPLERFIAWAVLADLRALARPGEAVSADLLAQAIGDVEVSDRIVVCFSGWTAEKWNRPDFYGNNPFLHQEAAAWLVEHRIAALALDFSVDGGPPYPNHQLLLGHGVPLIENLTNLDQITKREFLMIALPLPVAGGNGAPARVVAGI